MVHEVLIKNNVTIYTRSSGSCPFVKWVSKIKNNQHKASINLRVHRMSTGNFGDYKHVVGDIYELRIFSGPGFRVYYAKPSPNDIVILNGGLKDKRQEADIRKAQYYWTDYLGRT